MANTTTALDTKRLRALVLTLAYPHRASYYDDWQNAFEASPNFDCTVQNILGLERKAFEKRLGDFDVIIALHSCSSDTLEYLTPLAAALANRAKARLVVFIGNEFNSPYVSMPKRIAFLKDARADLAATQLLQEAGDFLYESSSARVVSIPHALNPNAFKPGPPYAARPTDLGFKGYRYPPYLGDDDRNRMLDVVTESARRHRLKTDIGIDARLSRDDWAGFLGQCRGTISTETGSWYLAPDDTLMEEIHTYLRSKDRGVTLSNDGRLRRLARRLPTPVKSALWQVLKKGPVKFEMFEDFNTSFAELDARFFKHRVRAPVYTKAISSRHFDAIGKATCQIMLEGRYNDILRAGEHYIAVKADFGNVDEAIRQFKDLAFAQKIAKSAYGYVMAHHTYAHRAASVYAMLTGT